MDSAEAYVNAYQDMLDEMTRYPRVASEPYAFAFGLLAGRVHFRNTWDRDALEASVSGIKDAIRDAHKMQDTTTNTPQGDPQ